jgi:hypothetical protein
MNITATAHPAMYVMSGRTAGDPKKGYYSCGLFSSGGAHGTAPEMKPLWDALYSAGAEIAIGGHDRDYERCPQYHTWKS